MSAGVSKDVAIWEVDDGHETIEGLDEHGNPDPAYAAALGLLPAPLGRRAGAAAIDVVGYLLLQIPYWIFAFPLVFRLLTGRISWYGFVNHPNFVLAIVMAGLTTFLTLAYCITQLALHGRKGTTLGKGVLGIRTVNVKTLAKPGIGRVLLRALVLWGSAVVVVGPIAFLVSPLFDRERRGRGWHDEVGQTWLVDVWHGLEPYDEKRMRVARKTVTAAPVPQHKALPSLATSADADPRATYRPGARVSSGVLGVASPHEKSGRPSVGLTGLEPAEPPATGSSEEAPGRPVLGGYLATGPATQSPDTPTGPEQPALPVPAATPPAAAPVAPAGGFVLQLDTGEGVEVNEPLVLGRAPADADGARSVPIVDDTHSVSKTHLAVRPVDHGVEVVDRNSTNGTELVHDGVARLLEAGVPAVAVPGDRIRFGDRSAVVARG